MLVVLDPRHAHSRALARAKMIADKTTRLHLLMCDPKADHAALLNLLESQLHDEGFDNVTSEQAWHGSLHASIDSVQQTLGCDLVIKEHRADSPLRKALLTPDDCKLLRECRCAVLMVQSEDDWRGRVILAAVDAGSQDEAHRRLHASILEHAQAFADRVDAQLHVITACPAALLSAEDSAYRPSETLEQRSREACRALQDAFGITDRQLHVARGPADVLIPDAERHYGAVLTVMGTMARSGLAGALVGNTAEVVLDSLAKDVLVLKSDMPALWRMADQQDQPPAPQ